MKVNNKLVGITLSFFIALTLQAGTYDYNYDVSTNGAQATKISNEKDVFMYSKFKEIIRFNPIHFDGDTVDEKGQELVENIIKKIKNYKENNEELNVTIIGHTCDTDEKAIDYANHVKSKFVDANLTQEMFVTEDRLNFDDAYSVKDDKLNKRVAVSIYVYDKK